MTLLLRKSSAQARIEGWESSNWPDDDYAAVDDTIRWSHLSRNDHRENRSGDGSCKRQVRGAADYAANQGMADTLEEAQAAKSVMKR